MKCVGTFLGLLVYARRPFTYTIQIEHTRNQVCSNLMVSAKTFRTMKKSSYLRIMVEQTIEYLLRYQYGEQLIRKLAEAMEK